VKQKTVVIVNPDGSGKIVVSRVFTKQAIAMIEQQMKQMAAGFDGPDVQMEKAFFNEEMIKRSASQFGPHVKYDKAKEVKKEGSRGYAALYTFEDIEDVQVPFDLRTAMMSMAMSMSDEMGDMEVNPFGQVNEDMAEFSFDASNRTLTVSLPAFVADVKTFDTSKTSSSAMDEMFEGVDMDAPMAPGDGGMFAGAGGNPREMMEQMYGGMRMMTAIEIAGLNKTTASHPDLKRPKRFTLFDVDFDKTLKTMDMETLMMSGEMMGDGDSNPLAQMNGMPGVTMETNRTIRFEFK
jgi:hypothetical protein